ncbi:hypothetical protein ACFLXJ_03125 [Chloroflexota bacterium]
MSLFKKHKWPSLTPEEIRKRARILVIDDSEFYYLDLFKKDGYAIDKWDDVDDLQKLERGEYDVILLDIQGVGKEQSADQGFGILKHLRHVNPTQIIIAYSNADWNLQYQDFFRMADATLSKGSDYVDFKRHVDELLMEKFSMGFYVAKIVYLATPYVNDKEKLQKAAERAILSRDINILKRYTEKNIDKAEIAKLVLQIAQVAIGIATLL